MSRLSHEEMLTGAVAGVYRRIRSTVRGKRDRHGHDGRDVWGMEIEGALAELFVCRELGVYWSGQQGQGARDVAGFEVRQSSHDFGRLILHKDDDDDARYLLVTGSMGSYRLRGWILGRRGKRPDLWIDPTGKGRFAYFVPQGELSRDYE